MKIQTSLALSLFLTSCGPALETLDPETKSPDQKTTQIESKSLPEPQGEILFYSQRENKTHQLYSMDINGKTVKQLTKGSSPAYNGHWGTGSIPFIYSAQENKQYEVMISQNGTNGNISNHPEQDDFAQLSPNGESVVFQSERQGSKQLFKFDIASKRLTQLTQKGLSNQYAEWSPDGQQLVFLSQRTDKKFDIALMNANGTGLKILTDNAASTYSPKWSPDGQQLLYLSEENQNWLLYTMNIEGKEKNKLTTTGSVITPSWSPDGQFIAYIHKGTWNADGDDAPSSATINELMVVSRDGKSHQKVYSGTGLSKPMWTPDGNHLVFQFQSGFNAEIYRIGINGQGLTNLTQNRASDHLCDIK